LGLFSSTRFVTLQNLDMDKDMDMDIVSKSDLSESAKHPVLLSAKDKLVRLMVKKLTKEICMLHHVVFCMN
jgi:hypothetical protein